MSETYYSKQFFEENFSAQQSLHRAKLHILQQSSVRFQDGVIVLETIPEAFWIVHSLLASLEADFNTAKMLKAARSSAAALPQRSGDA